MHGRPKVSPDNTYIFDNDDLEQLDELSLTSVIGEADVSLDEPIEAAEVDSSEGAEESSDPFAVESEDQLSIDELLGSCDPEADDQETSSESDLEDTATHLATEVLISPEEIFSKEEIDGGS